MSRISPEFSGLLKSLKKKVNSKTDLEHNYEKSLTERLRAPHRVSNGSRLKRHFSVLFHPHFRRQGQSATSLRSCKTAEQHPKPCQVLSIPSHGTSMGPTSIQNSLCSSYAPGHLDNIFRRARFLLGLLYQ